MQTDDKNKKTIPIPSNKKFVIRTYARDIAAVKNSPSTVTIPTTKQIHNIPGQESTVPKSKEVPEIPIDMVVLHQKQTTTSRSFWSKLWSWLLVSNKTDDIENATDNSSGEVVHENIVISPPDTIKEQEQSYNRKPLNSSSAQSVQPQSDNIVIQETTPDVLDSTPVQQQAAVPVRPPRISDEVVIHEDIVPPTVPAKINPAINIPTPSQDEDEREKILERLRSKVPQKKNEENNFTVGSILPPPPKHEQPAPPTQTPIKKTTERAQNSPTISPIHTYKTDFVDTVRKTGASATSILAVEHDAQSRTKSHIQKAHKASLWFVIGGAFLVVISIVGIGYAYLHNIKETSPAPIILSVPSLIPSNTSHEISGSGPALLQALAQTAQIPLQNGSVAITYLATTTKSKNGAIKKRPLPGGYIIAALHLPIPTILMNNTAVNSTIGIVAAGNQTRPFFILRVASYDVAFAGMLRWENSIATNLQEIYPAIINPNTANATSTSTTTVQTNKVIDSTVNTFVDETILNHNVRILRNSSRQSIMLYGFANRNTLIIARNAASFIVLLNKLNQ